ncbi:MAG TPA: hypothetical protein VJ983_03705, partial [candidate division Zixibacteria bacterium]|nr:hypothetical protein [candidate division Zixibacteria bacterium]
TLCNSCGSCYEACPSKPYPLERRLSLGKQVVKEGKALEITHRSVMGPDHDLTPLTGAQPMPEPQMTPVEGGAK